MQVNLVLLQLIFIFLDHFNISKATAVKTYQRYLKTGSLESLPRSGAPTKILKRDESMILRTSVNNPHLSSTELAAEFNEFNDKMVSSQHIRRILFRNGLKSYKALKKQYLTKKMKRKRLEFAKTYIEKGAQFWKNVIYSDESYISINLNAVMNRIRRFRSSNPLSGSYINQNVKYPLKIMVW